MTQIITHVVFPPLPTQPAIADWGASQPNVFHTLISIIPQFGVGAIN